jgi:hypothetical protein
VRQRRESHPGVFEAHGDQQELGGRSVEHEAADPGDDDPTVVGAGGQGERPRVPAGGLPVQRHRGLQRSAGDAREPALLLGRVPGELERMTGQHGRREVGRRDERAAHLLEHDPELDHTEPRAAVCVREGQPRPAELREELEEVRAGVSRIVDRLADPPHRALPLEHLPGAPAQQLLVLAEGDVHAANPPENLRHCPRTESDMESDLSQPLFEEPWRWRSNASSLPIPA